MVLTVSPFKIIKLCQTASWNVVMLLLFECAFKSPWQSVASRLSVSVVLICGEILPSAVFTGPNQCLGVACWPRNHHKPFRGTLQNSGTEVASIKTWLHLRGLALLQPWCLDILWTCFSWWLTPLAWCHKSRTYQLWNAKNNRNISWWLTTLTTVKSRGRCYFWRLEDRSSAINAW